MWICANKKVSEDFIKNSFIKIEFSRVLFWRYTSRVSACLSSRPVGDNLRIDAVMSHIKEDRCGFKKQPGKEWCACDVTEDDGKSERAVPMIALDPGIFAFSWTNASVLCFCDLSHTVAAFWPDGKVNTNTADIWELYYPPFIKNSTLAGEQSCASLHRLAGSEPQGFYPAWGHNRGSKQSEDSVGFIGRKRSERWERVQHRSRKAGDWLLAGRFSINQIYGLTGKRATWSIKTGPSVWVKLRPKKDHDIWERSDNLLWLWQ